MSNNTVQQAAEHFVQDFCKPVYYQSEACHKAAFSGFIAGAAWQSPLPHEVAEERFVKPTDEQIIKGAILFNNGGLDHEKLGDMVALCMWAIDRLYENGDIQIPSSKENNDNG